MLRFVRACLVDYLSDGPFIQPPLPLPSQEAFWLALNEQLLKVDRCLPATQQLFFRLLNRVQVPGQIGLDEAMA